MWSLKMENKPDNTILKKKERRRATPDKVLRYFPINANPG
jgi:hypothetical protein